MLVTKQSTVAIDFYCIFSHTMAVNGYRHLFMSKWQNFNYSLSFFPTNKVCKCTRLCAFLTFITVERDEHDLMKTYAFSAVEIFLIKASAKCMNVNAHNVYLINWNKIHKKLVWICAAAFNYEIWGSVWPENIIIIIEKLYAYLSVDTLQTYSWP